MTTSTGLAMCETYEARIRELEAEKAQMVPRSVADDLAEALAVIAADTHDHETAEDGRTWRTALAHVAHQKYEAAYPREETP